MLSTGPIAPRGKPGWSWPKRAEGWRTKQPGKRLTPYARTPGVEAGTLNPSRGFEEKSASCHARTDTLTEPLKWRILLYKHTVAAIDGIRR